MSNIALIAGNLVSDSGASLSSKADLVDGKVPSTQLPSYVDDVLEYANLAGFPVTGEAGKIYVAQDSNKIYRWSGTTYIEVSPTVGTVWGGITGTLLNQTDLQAALDAKVAGTGTVNYISKFTSTSGLGNSQIFDNGTNVGIGVVPLATTLGKSLSIGSAGNGLLSYDVGNTYLTQNTYYNGAWKYANSAAASQFILFGGEHLFYTAPSGTAGTNVTLTERMRITSAGNVGIGDTSPSDLLVVNGRMRVNGANPIAFGNSAGGYAQIGVTAATTGNLAFSTYDGASLGERMRITAAGNVGIGTISPAEKLQVVGNIRIQNETGLITDFGTLVGRYNTDQVYVGIGSYSIVKIARADGGGLNALPGGNVGIGTSSPNVKLEVAGLGRFTGTNGFSIGADAGQNRIQYSTSTFSRFALLSSGDAYAGLTAKELSIGATYGGTAPPSSGAIIEGNVGIGTTSPSTRLHVSGGNIFVDNANGSVIVRNGDTTNQQQIRLRMSGNDGILDVTRNSGTTPNLIFGTEATERMRIDSSGNVAIGVTSADSTSLRIVPTSTDTVQRVLHIGYNGSMSSGTHGSLITFGNSTPSTAQLARIGAFYEGNTYMGSLRFYTNADTEGANPSERMRITQAGNVGIGKTTVNTKLDIAATKNTTGLRLSPIGASTAGDYTQIGIGDAPMNVDYAALRFIYENGLGNWFNTSIAFLTHDAFPGNSITEKMRITSAGNVGIGATNPGSMINTGAFFKPEAAGEHLDILSPSNEAVLNLRSNRDTSGGQVGGIYFTRDSGQGDAHRHIGAIQVRQSSTGTLAGGSMLFFTKTANGGVGVDAARMIIDSAGGITIPALGGTGTRIVTADTNGFLAASTLSSSIVGGSGTVNYLSKFTATGTIGNSQIFDNGTNVGIGTASPQEKLHISSGNFALTSLSSLTTGSTPATGTQKLILGGNSSNGVGNEIGWYPNNSFQGDIAQITAIATAFGSSAAGALLFRTNTNLETTPSEKMRITSAGNVGIGTATPVTRLDVFTTSTNGIDLRNTPTTLGDQTSKNSPRLRLVSSRYEGGNVDAPFSFQNIRTGSPTNDQRLAITNFGDVEVMSILNAGNVGIANPNPVNRLHVYSPNRTSLTATGGGINLNYNGSTTGEFSTIGFSWASSVNDHTRWGMGLTGTNFSSGLADLFFFNGGVERMRVNAFGHVGIGVTPSSWSGVSPSLQLGVSPFIASTGQYLYLASNIYYDGTNGIYTSNGSATTYAQSEGNHMFNTAGSGTTGGIATFTERMRITSGGNVGIGTQTPALRAQINASGAGSPATSGTTQTGALRLSNGYSNVVADFGFDISNNVWMQMTNAAALGTNYNLLINPNGGNVGIGTTSPNARLEVRDGDISVSTFNTFSYFNANRLTVLSGVGQILGGLRFQAYSTGTTLVQGAQILAYSNEAWTSSTAATYLSFQTTQSGAITTTERMRIFPNGRIGINTTTDAGYQLDVNGGTRVTGRLTITGNDTLAQTMSRAGTSAFSSEIYNSGGDNSWLIWGVESSVGGVIFPGSTAYAAVIGQFRNTPLEFFTNNTIRGSFSGAGAFRVHNLAGTGSRIVVADANGVLSTTDTAPVTGTGTTNYIPKFTAASTIGNSQIFDNGTNVGVGTASPTLKFQVIGDIASSTRVVTDLINGYNGGSTPLTIQTGGAQNLIFGTNATERLRIFANGRIGVNTTTDAGYQLDVNGSIRSIGLIRSQATVGNINGYFQLDHPGAQTWKLGVFTDNTSTFSIGNDLGGTFASRYLNITNAGNVGIGTTTPDVGSVGGRVLAVSGAFTRSRLNLINTDGVGAGAISGTMSFINSTTYLADIEGGTGSVGVDDAYLAFRTKAAGGGLTTRLYINSSGNVGIGTTSPSSVLHVYGPSSGDNIRIQTAGVSALKVFSNNQTSNSFDFAQGFASASDNVGYVWNNANAAMVLGTNATERLRITAGGNVGIGTGSASPVTKLHISQSNSGNYASVILLSNSADAAADRTGIYGSPSPGAAAPYRGGITFHPGASGAMSFHTGNNNSPADGTRMYIQSNGRIGINTTSDAGYQLDVNGSFRGLQLYTGSFAEAGGFMQFNYSSGNASSRSWRASNDVVAYGDFAIGQSTTQTGSTYNNTRFYISNAGNVGIGTASPTSKLDVVENAVAINQLRVGQDAVHKVLIGAETNYAEIQAIRVGVDFNKPLVIQRQGGNVGIGTASPAEKLEVVGGNIQATKTSGEVAVVLRQSTTNFFAFHNATDYGLYANDYGTLFGRNKSTGLLNIYDKLYINSNSEVLINTTSDAGDYKLQVSGNIYNTGSAVLAAAGGEVLIGTTTDLGAYKLQVNGISFFGSNANKYALLNNTSSNAAIQAYGDWVNHLRLTYPAVVDFDMQVTAAGELDVKRSSNVVTRINAAGKFLINTTTDVGDYKLQVNGSVYNTGQVTAGVINIQGTGAQLFVDGTTNLSPLSAIQTLSGANNSAFLSGNVTWNTTGSPNAIDISVTNTASGSNANFMQLGDGTNNFKVTKDAGIITANPTSGTARKWKLGSVVSSTVVLVTSQYVEVEINGTFYRLALVTPA